MEVDCPACGKHFTVEAPAAPAPPPPPAPRAPGAMTCPKCGDAQPPALACRSCGLLADRMADFARARELAVPAEVTAAWDGVDAAWGDPEVHERFIRAVAATLSFPYAAQRYREALRLRPDDATATSQLARIARMAEVSLWATASQRPQKTRAPYRATLLLLAALLILILVGTGVAFLAVGS